MSAFPHLAKHLHFTYPAALRPEWTDPKLGPRLIIKYFAAHHFAADEGCLFDLGNLSDALGQHHLGYHFVEWWTAVELYQRYGLLSLVGKYAGRYKHAAQQLHKWRVKRFKEVVVPDNERKFLKNGTLPSEPGNKRIKLPDLLVYTPDKMNYAFVEVKGPGDSLTPEQIRSFEEIEKCLRRGVHIASLKET